MLTKLFYLIFPLCLSSFAQQMPNLFNYNVDNFPDLYGGKMEFRRLLKHHLVYPPKDLKKKTEGTVSIYFIVTKEGKAAKAKVMRSVSPEIDHEALRLLSLIEWFPGRQHEKPINVEWGMQIKFSVSKYKKWVKERGYTEVAFNDLPTDSSFVVFDKADKQPVFNIPDKTLDEFVLANFDYPKEAILHGIEGKMIVTWVVEPDGYCTNIRIQQGIGGGCNLEMIRVIGLTKWKPAVKDGKYIRCRMTYVLDLNLKNTFKDNSFGSQRGGGQ